MTKVQNSPLSAACAIGLTVSLIAGCGGSSSGGGDASSIVSRGIITGFGSVYVNGKRFGTGDARIEVDDAAGTESDLGIGMLVTVRGSSSDGDNWSASQITYDNELKGPVSSIMDDPNDPTRKTVVILGQSVLLDANTIFDDDGGLTFDTIDVGDVVEVSGFITDTGLVATHIELQNNDLEIEIKGHIENLTASGFEIKGFPVSYDSNTLLDDIAVLSEGLYVEVEGQLDSAGSTLIAVKIEREDDDLDEDMDEVEIEGVISSYDPADQTFMLQGQLVDAGSAYFSPASLVLAEGLTVEVEGYFANGILVAEKVKQRGKKIEIKADLSAVDDASVSFSFDGSVITAVVNQRTELEDETGNPVFAISDLSVGDFVELEAFEDGSGVINAIEIERKSVAEIEVEAALDSFNGNDNTVVLLGVEFDLSAAIFEDENDSVIDVNSFFGSLSPGQFIEIEDADRNGVFDKASLDD